jgi:hypothetical protein
MPVKLRVTIEGHKALMKAIRADTTLAPPLRETYDRIGVIGVAAGRSAAPVNTGQLRSSIMHRVMGRQVATAVSIRATATRSSPKRRRYPYPKRLEYDRKSRHRGWLRQAIKRSWARIQAELRRTEQEIQRQFGVG